MASRPAHGIISCRRRLVGSAGDPTAALADRAYSCTHTDTHKHSMADNPTGRQPHTYLVTVVAVQTHDPAGKEVHKQQQPILERNNSTQQTGCSTYVSSPAAPLQCPVDPAETAGLHAGCSQHLVVLLLAAGAVCSSAATLPECLCNTHNSSSRHQTVVWVWVD